MAQFIDPWTEIDMMSYDDAVLTEELAQRGAIVTGTHAELVERLHELIWREIIERVSREHSPLAAPAPDSVIPAWDVTVHITAAVVVWRAFAAIRLGEAHAHAQSLQLF